MRIFGKKKHSENCLNNHLLISASLKPLIFSRGMVLGRPRFFGLLRSEGESLSEPEYLLLLLCRPSTALKLIC